MFNRRNNRIENILDDCLERILVRGESVDECLARYRQFADELEPLLRTAIATKKAVAIEPRPEFRARARYQFHSALKDAASKKQRRFFGWQLRWVTMASLALTLLLSGGGIVAAASNSMPDSPLYQVKLATEQIQLFLTTSPEDKAELYAKLVDRRVAEIINMAEEGNVSLVEATTQRLDNHLSMITSISVKRTDGALLGGVTETETKSTVTTTVPTTVAAEGILTDEAPDTWPTATTPTAGDAVPTVAVPYATTTLPTDSSDKGLSHQLRQQSADNIAALYTALESASEEVKPALMQAIAVLESGYNNALNTIGE
jgi:hypothetical protein